jgi:phosphoribosylformylglycinamidine (FGAM) synthase-like amidotransferase family enzyme
VAAAFPELPNGAEEAAAAVCNARGNVLAVMPHPERALVRGQVARAIGGEWHAGDAYAAGPGAVLFAGLERHLVEA